MADHTDPALVRTWMTGPPQYDMPGCDIDLREGGAYRFVWEWEEDRKLQRMAACGTFRDIDPERRLFYTEALDMWPHNETLVDQTFRAEGNRTHVTMLLTYPSMEVRNAALASPMEEGLEASCASLDRLLP
ncbi:MAG: SRPBCC domain-containing protein [Pseudomonadota bacterium]